MRIRILTLAVTLAVTGRGETVSKLWSRGYAVMPDPQQVELLDGDRRFSPDWMLKRGARGAGDDVAIETLTHEPESRYGLRTADTSNSPTVGPPGMKAASESPGATAEPDKHAHA